MKRRLFSLVLAICMVISMLPVEAMTEAFDMESVPDAYQMLPEETEDDTESEIPVEETVISESEEEIPEVTETYSEPMEPMEPEVPEESEEPEDETIALCAHGYEGDCLFCELEEAIAKLPDDLSAMDEAQRKTLSDAIQKIMETVDALSKEEQAQIWNLDKLLALAEAILAVPEIPQETEAVPDESIPAEVLPEETLPDNSAPDEQPEESIPEESVPEETVLEESVSEETEDFPICIHEQGAECLLCAMEAEIDRLPSYEELLEMDEEAYVLAYEQIQNIMNRFLELSEEKQMQIANAEKLFALLKVFKDVSQEGLLASGSGETDLTWTLDTDGTLTVFDSNIMNDSPWRQYAEDITAVIIEKGVNIVRRNAFYGCSNLVKVSLPEGLKEISPYAFYGCGLENVAIPDSVEIIGDEAFALCENLSSVILPQKWKKTKELYSISPFDGCNSLASITLPEGIEILPSNAFKNLTAVETIALPKSLTTIGSGAFEGCSNLKRIDLPEGLQFIGPDVFAGCSALKGINLPENLLGLGSGAFKGCAALERIWIPDQINSVSGETFSGCTNLVDVRLPEGISWISNSAFLGCGMEELVLPDNVTAIYDRAFQECINLKKINLPESLRSIGSYAFTGCASLESILIPTQIKVINNGVFYGCTNLMDVGFLEGLTTIRELAFGECGMEEVVLPDSVETIYGRVFGSCKNLSSVILPQKWEVKDGVSPFYGCNSLTSVILPEGMTSLPRYAFYGCTGLESVVLPDSVTSIGSYAFEECTGLKSVVLPDSVTSIESYAFKDCTGLESIVFPDSVTTIGARAFDGCIGLESVVFSDSVTTIGAWAFDGCIGLESVVLPDSMTSIEEGTFGNCTGLEKVVLPNGVISIGARVFANCKVLKTVALPESVISIDYSAFAYCEALKAFGFRGDMPQIRGAFWGVNAKAYYPVSNNTYTEDKLRDYDGKLAWIPYDPATEDLEALLMAECFNVAQNLSELTTIDYLAFSWFATVIPAQLGYVNKTIEEVVGDNRWNSSWEGTGILNSELLAHVRTWKIDSYVDNSTSGLRAYAFTNPTRDCCTVAFAGSSSLNLDSLLHDPDWIPNDFYMLIGGEGNQLSRAIKYAEMVINEYGKNRTTFTGYSLGGGLCDILSAYYDCYAESFNSAPFLPVAFYYYPEQMSRYFTSTGEWKFIDHIIQNDLVGSFADRYKNLRVYQKSAWSSDTHSLSSFVELKKSTDSLAAKTIQLTPLVSTARPSGMLSFRLALKDTYVKFGSRGNDKLMQAFFIPSVNGRKIDYCSFLFGGSGNDKLTTGFRWDVLSGGPGDDELTGRGGNDRYYYRKGDGVDYIMDSSGNDTIYLLGFSGSDRIDAVSGDRYVTLKANGQPIIHIARNRNIGFNGFTIRNQANSTSMDISSLFKGKNVGQCVSVACPVSLEIVDDATGAVVYRVTGDESSLGTHYTDYGYLYVYQDGNGDFVKEAELFDGYSVQIVGEGEGTMNVMTYEIMESGIGNTHQITDIPVTKNLVAVIEESKDETYIFVDPTGTGEFTQTMLMDRETDHVHTGGKASCTEQAVCEVCGRRYGVISHDEVIDEAVAPNCTQTGLTMGKHCSVCGEILVKREIVAALGHSFQNGKCTVCGEKESAQVTTDIRLEDGKLCYYVNGVFAKSFTGLVLHQGEWYNVQKGIVDVDYTGLVRFNGLLYYVTGGKVDFTYCNLAAIDGEWYYADHGVVYEEYTGLVRYGSILYYVNRGRCDWNFYSLYPLNGEYVYVCGGVVYENYCGLVRHTDGILYYVTNSVADWNFVGLGSLEGQWFYVDHGVVYEAYTGLVPHDGIWYYVINGAAAWGFTGLVEYYGSWYYVQGGVIYWGLEAVVLFDGRYYYLKNSVLDSGYNGTFVQNGITYIITNGVAVKK